MNQNLPLFYSKHCKSCGFVFSNFSFDKESVDYEACQFELSGLNVISRSAKVTPKKNGQFVTFWKRIGIRPIMPYHEFDDFEFFVVGVKSEFGLGQFIFSKSLLIQKGIVSTENKDGKRAFRVYPPWSQPASKQAKNTQEWQLKCFVDLSDSLKCKKLNGLLGL